MVIARMSVFPLGHVSCRRMIVEKGPGVGLLNKHRAASLRQAKIIFCSMG